MKARYKTDYFKKNPPPPPRPTCAYANNLRKMPPLCHAHKLSKQFLISHSEVVRFIIFAMGGKTDRQLDWSDAAKLFYKARTNRVIVYSKAEGTWQGCEYDPATNGRTIRKWEQMAKCRPERKN